MTAVASSSRLSPFSLPPSSCAHCGSQLFIWYLSVTVLFQKDYREGAKQAKWREEIQSIVLLRETSLLRSFAVICIRSAPARQRPDEYKSDNLIPARGERPRSQLGPAGPRPQLAASVLSLAHPRRRQGPRLPHVPHRYLLVRPVLPLHPTPLPVLPQPPIPRPQGLVSPIPRHVSSGPHLRCRPCRHDRPGYFRTPAPFPPVARNMTGLSNCVPIRAVSSFFTPTSDRFRLECPPSPNSPSAYPSS